MREAWIDFHWGKDYSRNEAEPNCRCAKLRAGRYGGTLSYATSVPLAVTNTLMRHPMLKLPEARKR